MDCKNGGSLQKGPEPALLPEKAQVLQCLQPDASDVLSVCYCKHNLLRCGVLGCKHEDEGRSKLVEYKENRRPDPSLGY